MHTDIYTQIERQREAYIQTEMHVDTHVRSEAMLLLREGGKRGRRERGRRERGRWERNERETRKGEMRVSS